MKSFYEFYEKLKQKKQLNEQDAMVQPNLGMPATMPSMAPPANQMNTPAASADMNLANQQQAPEMGLDDADSGDKGIQPNTAPPEGGVTADTVYPMMDQIVEFINKVLESAGDDDEKKELGEGLLQKIDAIKNDLISFTGVQPPDSGDEETADEMGGQQPDQSGTGIEQMSPAEAEGGGAPATGGMPGMPNAQGAPDAGAGMMQGMGGPAVGGGGSFFGM